MTHKRSIRRIWPTAAACVAAAAALSGSLPVGASAAAAVPNRIEVTGQPLVHEFDLSLPGDSVQTTWVVRHQGAGTVQFDGALVATDGLSSELARALQVEFGRVDPTGNLTWSTAGSVVDARSFTGTLSGTTTVDVPVRVVLTRPDLVAATEGRQTVEADFLVRYLRSDQDRSLTADHHRRMLAVTGDDLFPILLVAFSLLLVGRGIVLFVRVRRQSRAQDEHSESLDF